jgi:hypothetical protein
LYAELLNPAVRPKTLSGFCSIAFYLVATVIH